MDVVIQDDFDLNKIISCGQCFRALPVEEEWYCFPCGSSVLYLRQTGPEKYEATCTRQEWISTWQRYFDLDRSYSQLRKRLKGRDPLLDQAMEYGKGIRILRQDPWEMLLTFIISQRKSIPAIRNTVEHLAERYGRRVETDYGAVFLFPSPEELRDITLDQLRTLGTGYRAEYLLDAIRRVNDGKLDLTGLDALPSGELLHNLEAVYGVGKKVANCIALFGYGRTECVPVDVWISRAIRDAFGGTSPFEGCGNAAGIVQQYVFYYTKAHAAAAGRHAQNVSQNSGSVSA